MKAVVEDEPYYLYFISISCSCVRSILYCTYYTFCTNESYCKSSTYTRTCMHSDHTFDRTDMPKMNLIKNKTDNGVC